MAYTNIWNDTLPTGSEAANTLDDIIRGLKVDVEERFEDIFAMPNFTDDPLRPYGFKFTDAQNAVISMGDNAGTPRSILVKNKAGAVTYLTIASTSLTHAGPLNSLSGTSALQAISGTTLVLTTPAAAAYGGTGVNNGTNNITLNQALTLAGGFATTITTTAISNATLPAGTTILLGCARATQTVVAAGAWAVLIPDASAMYKLFVFCNQNGKDEYAEALVFTTPDGTIILHTNQISAGISLDLPGAFVRLNNLGGASLDLVATSVRLY